MNFLFSNISDNALYELFYREKLWNLSPRFYVLMSIEILKYLVYNKDLTSDVPKLREKTEKCCLKNFKFIFSKFSLNLRFLFTRCGHAQPFLESSNLQLEGSTSAIAIPQLLKLLNRNSAILIFSEVHNLRASLPAIFGIFGCGIWLGS